MTNERIEEYACGDSDFAEWLEAIDAILTNKLGLGLFDCADMNTRDAFDAGTTPEEFVREDVVAELGPAYMEYLA